MLKDIHILYVSLWRPPLPKARRRGGRQFFSIDNMTRREIHYLDFDQGGGKGGFSSQHVFASIFMNTYPYVPIFYEREVRG